MKHDVVCETGPKTVSKCFPEAELTALYIYIYSIHRFLKVCCIKLKEKYM